MVSLIPGVFLFRMAGGIVDLLQPGGAEQAGLLGAVMADGGNAFLIMMAITLGVILPRMAYEWMAARRAVVANGGR